MKHADRFTALLASALIASIAAATITAALVFEHVFGYAPCPLCLQERWPYYVGVPIALVAAIAAWADSPRRVTLFLIWILALTFIISAGLGSYHSGIEWGFWPGPSGCSGGSVTNTAGSLMGQLQATARVARCDEAAWRFMGLSFAGWNAAISLVLAVIAFTAATKTRRDHGSSSVSQ